MLYLTSLRPEQVVLQDGEVDPWAPSGEPVIPAYPAPVRNVFMSVTSFKDAPYAKVVETDIDPDALVDRLAAEFPGLPRGLHEAYVLAIARLAMHWPLDTTFQLYITPDSAQARAVGQEDQTEVLWESQPLPA